MHNQPNPPDPAAILADLCARHGTRQDQLLPLLHALQDSLGYVPPDLVQPIAQHFNLSRAEVHGVITFYHDFRSAPAAQCVVKLCSAEACQSMGGERLLHHAQQALGCGLHGHGADGRFALEPVYCLGLCASAPAMAIADKVFARVTPARFDAVLSDHVADHVAEAV